LVEGELYCWIADDLLLKCLDSDQAKVAMGDVHDGICGTHKSSPKMKWLLWRGGFYWPTEYIIHRFDIPQTLMTDQGTSFVSVQVKEFIESYKIRLLNSSLYYAQANGQAESNNKTLIKLIKKKIEDNPWRLRGIIWGIVGSSHI
jgi:transposase InsO family protein